MSLTASDLFCGAGGSSLGAQAAGVDVTLAINHWDVAIDVHQPHFPNARHDCADISQADPRRYPRTDILIASPECTNHSQARGVSRRKQDQTLWDAPDPAAERSRATMWDVVRFTEQMHYLAVIVENVVEASQWVGWRAWHMAMLDLGYEHRVVSINSMHHGVPQSRDRIYIVFWRAGLDVGRWLDRETTAWCPHCSAEVTAVQGWKNGKTLGRYRQQWIWVCTTCGREAKADAPGADTILDWSLPCPRIGDRKKPLATKTRARVGAGIARHWGPFITAGAGNTYETTPGNRSKPTTEPLAVQQASATHALAVPGFLVPTHGDERRRASRSLDEPHPTVCASDDRMSLVVPLRANGKASPTDGPIPTVAAAGTHHALLVRNYGNVGGDPGRHVTPADEPVRTVTASPGMALLMRNNGGGAEMVTPVNEPARTLTSKGHQSLLVPYYGNGQAQPTSDSVPTVPTRDRFALATPGDLTVADLERIIDECGFRMLEPHEIELAMAFPGGYIPANLTKKARVKLAGNAVTPPVMTWIASRVVAALGATA